MTEELKIVISADDKATGVLKGIGNIAGSVLKLGAMGAAVGFGALTTGIGLSIKAAMDAEKKDAQLNAVLKSTKGIAGVTADEIKKLATRFSELTPFEDEVIQSAQSMLLTFTNIKKDVFPGATEATLDMATALGMDATQAAMMLGKALNSPVEGVGALRRVGVQLSDAQEEQIKKFMAVNDVASAQKIILGELKTEFGGSAKAAGETFGGQLEILKNKFGNLMEEVGTAFLPVLKDATKYISDNVMPIFKNWSEQISEAVKTGDFSKIATNMQTWITDEKNWAPVKTALGKFAGDFWKWLTNPEDGALLVTGEKMVSVLDSFTTWASDEKTKVSLNQTGQDIGKSIVKGIKELFGPETDDMKDLGKSIVIGLAGAIKASHEAMGEVGAGIAGSIFEGFAKDLGPDQKTFQTVKKAIEDFFRIMFTSPTLLDFAVNLGFSLSGRSPGSYQTKPGEYKIVPGPPSHEVPLMGHGGEIFGRPPLRGMGSNRSDTVLCEFSLDAFQQMIELGIITARRNGMIA